MSDDLSLYTTYANENNLVLGAIIDRWLKSAEVIASVSLGDITNKEGNEILGGLTIEEVATNAGTYTRKNGETYAAGKVITYKKSGGTRGVTYYVEFAVTITGRADPLIVRQPLKVI